MFNIALQKNSKGFTLMELMVVVAIMAILTAVAVPIFTDVRDPVKITACQANERELQAAAAAYQAKTGNICTDLKDLVPEYIASLPVCPVDGVSYEMTEDGIVQCPNRDRSSHR